MPVHLCEESPCYAVRQTIHAYKVPSRSMIPTLLPGDHLLADEIAYRSHAPERFDVVVFETLDEPERLWIKRVIGLPGDTVELRQREVFVNGAALSEPYLPAEAKLASPNDKRDNMAPTIVPEGSYFLLGDNRDHSHDSRYWGAIAADKIQGRVKILYFSWSDTSPHVRWDRIGTPVR